MEFLEEEGMDKYKKDTIIKRPIVRIQSLFPDDCALCKQSYTVHYKSKPLLSCAKCSQSIHTRCLASTLGVAEIDLEAMSADDIQAAINPTGISTLMYLCGYCHKSEIARDDQGLRQTKKPKQVSDLADSHNLINLDSDDATEPRSKNPLALVEKLLITGTTIKNLQTQTVNLRKNHLRPLAKDDSRKQRGTILASTRELYHQMPKSDQSVPTTDEASVGMACLAKDVAEPTRPCAANWWTMATDIPRVVQKESLVISSIPKCAHHQ